MYVGKTNQTADIAPLQRKHPHARGENGERGSIFIYREETPPRRWGRPLLLQRRLKSK